jgi:hypothetical protein
MPGTTILRVYSYEPGTKAIKQKRTLELPDASDLSKIDLASIRSTLNKNKTLDSTEYGFITLEKIEATRLTNHQCESSFLRHCRCRSG